MLNENHFTKDAYEDNGRFQIHPLNSEGLEAYLSKDSYNYHFLKSRYDPALLKQVEEEYKAEKEKKLQLKNQNKINVQNQDKENPKIEDIKAQNNPPLNVNNNDKNINTKKPAGIKESSGINKGKVKGNNNIKKKDNNTNNNVNKIKSIRNPTNPVISNVKNDRGRLKDFQQPYHS